LRALSTICASTGERLSSPNSSSGRTDLLLRFFDSEFFNEWIAVQYLYTSKSTGVQDYICNRIYTLPESGIERYLSQMTSLLLKRPGSALERCVVDLCSRSLRLAVKVHWYLQAAFDDEPNSEYLKELMVRCETAAIRGDWKSPFRQAVTKLEGQVVVAGTCENEPPSNTQRASQGKLSHSSTQTERSMHEDLTSPRQRQGTYRATIDLVSKLCNASQGIKEIPSLVDRQRALRARLSQLNSDLDALPAHAGVLFPMGKQNSRIMRVPPEECTLLNSRDKAPFMICIEVINEDAPAHNFEEWFKPMEGDPLDRLARAGSEFDELRAALQDPDDVFHVSHAARAATSTIAATTAPALVPAGAAAPPPRAEPELEVSSPDKTTADARFSRFSASPMDSISQVVDAAMAELRDRKFVRAQLLVVPAEEEDGGRGEERVQVNIWPVGSKHPKRVASEDGLAAMMNSQGVHRLKPPRDSFGVPSVPSRSSFSKPSSIYGAPNQHLTEAQKQARLRAQAVFGERWSDRVARVREQSPYGSHPRWQLHNAIVKSGDDCRQELLAVQLMYTFHSIFQEAGLPLWCRPYQVLVTSGFSSFIETIPNALSIHAIKARSPAGTSLRNHFAALYVEGTAEFRTAQRNFVESLAGASIISYLLQLKDRHNGNLMLDDEGHIIHIDFGFMLSNSPGGINFESAPFKLTREFLEVMDSDAEGTGSDLFDYFKVLCIQGFLAVRKHTDRIVCMVEMMQSSNAPCYKAGPKVVTLMRQRFAPGRPEEACVELVLQLISESLDAWRTRQYDYYQRVVNGIL